MNAEKIATLHQYEVASDIAVVPWAGENEPDEGIAREIGRQLTASASAGDRLLSASSAPIFCLGMTSILARCLPGKRVIGITPGREEFNQRPSMEELAASVVRKIRALHPEGPYILGGYSANGMVAYETAQQLLALGQQVELLLIFDLSSAPRKDTIGGQARIELPHALTFQYFRKRCLHHVKMLVGCSPAQLWPYVRLRTDTVFQRIASCVPLMDRWVAEGWILTRIGEEYKPKPYPGKAVFFQAEKKPIGMTTNPIEGWRDYILGKLETYNIPGDHVTMFKDDSNVQVLGAQLRQCIDSRS